MCVLASNECLTAGFAQKLFMEWAGRKENMVMLTTRVNPATLGGKLLNIAADDTMKRPNASANVHFERRMKVPLEGKELDEWKRIRERKRKREEEERAQDEDSSSDEMGAEDLVYDRTQRKRVKMEAAFPMFPYVEVKHSADPHGQPIDYDLFRERKPERQTHMDEPMQVDVEEEPEEEAPVKTITRQEDIEVRCRVRFINFEGRSDGKSAKTIIQHVQPRKLIVIHGTEAAKQNLKEFVLRKCECDAVEIPKAGQTVNVTSNTEVVKILIKNSMERQLRFRRVGGYEVAYVNGMIRKVAKEVPEEQRHSGSEDDEKNQDVTAVPRSQENMPELMPLSGIESHRGHQASYLGDVKLLDIKLALNNEGFPAEFIDGQLVCGKGGIVRIKKDSSNEVRVRGTLSLGNQQDYFKIRSIVYDQYHIM